MPEVPPSADDPHRSDSPSSMGGGESVPEGLSGVWRIFTSQPGLGVVLFGPDRRIEWVNDHFVKEYIPSDQLVGRPISDFVAEQVAKEIQAALGKVERTDLLFIRKIIFKGFEHQVTYRWIADERIEAGRVLMTVQRGFPEPSEGEGVEVQRGEYMDLGVLSILSKRELEVLALVGEGLRVREIGEKLFRSPKTIESHLSSIYRKLKTSDRAVLMRIANDAGFDQDVVNRIRVDAVRVEKDAEERKSQE